MNKFIDGLLSEDSFTENGALAHSTSGERLVDFFFTVGSARGVCPERTWEQFYSAFKEGPLSALRALFWARDVRGGAGERDTFRALYRKGLSDPKIRQHFIKNIALIPRVGRWDDVLSLYGLHCEADDQIVFLVADTLGIRNGKFSATPVAGSSSLLAKWMPRKGSLASALLRELRLSPRDYRKGIVALSKTVEQEMSARKWSQILYKGVPSKAISQYVKAFDRHDSVRFDEWKRDLAEGRSKINAGAVFPHDVLRCQDVKVLRAQWAALPDFMAGSAYKNIVPVIDVSGSMVTKIGSMGTKISSKGETTVIDVAIGLGLYISERSAGPFRDFALTFSSRPTVFALEGVQCPKERARIVRQDSNWGMSTDIVALFEHVLERAISRGCPQSDFPDAMIILFDMQFDQADSGLTTFDSIRRRFADAGYKLPRLVFWNLSSPVGKSTIPVKSSTEGTVLVSGYSPSILSSVLSGVTDSNELVARVLDAPRYADIALA